MSDDQPLAPPTNIAPPPMSQQKTGEVTVHVSGLNFYFGEGDRRTQALFNVQLKLREGEITVMTGPSGCGKTTLLTVVGGLRNAQDGSAKVLGKELNGLSDDGLVALRRNIGFIFQAHNLFGSLTAMQNVYMALELVGISGRAKRERAKDLLLKLGLGERLYYRPGDLSGGQRQRVAIARALAPNPRLILADEPTAALDKESGKVVMDLLDEHAKQHGTTTLLVTHDKRVLERADRIVSMDAGKIVSDAVVTEIEEIVAYLKDSKLFEDLTPTELSDVADQILHERHPAGTHVIRQGEVGDKFYLIRSGLLDVQRTEGDQVRHLATIGPGRYFGEQALITNEPRNASVIAKTDVELFVLGKDDFNSAKAASDSFSQQIRTILASRQ